MARPKGVPRNKKEFVSTVTGEPPEKVDVPAPQPKAEFLPYTGKESVPVYQNNVHEKYRCRYFVIGNADKTMKLIRVYRGGRQDQKGIWTNGAMKRKLIHQFQPSNKKKPQDHAFYQRLKKDGLIKF